MTREATLRIPAIHCSGCATNIKRSLGAVPGVGEIDVDHETKEVRLIYEESRVSLEQITESLDEIGFGPDDQKGE